MQSLCRTRSPSAYIRLNGNDITAVFAQQVLPASQICKYIEDKGSTCSGPNSVVVSYKPPMFSKIVVKQSSSDTCRKNKRAVDRPEIVIGTGVESASEDGMDQWFEWMKLHIEITVEATFEGGLQSSYYNSTNGMKTEC